jgi:uncharacterized damage-inducible protein DinB
MPLEFTTEYIKDSLALFGYYKGLAEKAIAQVSDDELFRQLDAESNSLAIIMQHMIGNMRSRWTDFLTTDGEKPWRKRDSEFLQPQTTRAELLDQWEAAWQIVFTQLQPLTDADLSREITIRGERHSVMQATNRQVAHYSYHVGQIVFLAKHLRGSEWKTLSVPRNRSAEFNALVGSGKASQR